MSAPQDPDGFLARWSRRKRQAAATPGAEAPLAAPDAAADRDPPGEAARSMPAEAPPGAVHPLPCACPVPGAPEIDPASLPRLEDLTFGSDFKPFLRPGIPAALRSAALRRMWSLDPAIRDYIGPADYAWDYNDPAGMPGGFGLDLGGKVKKLLAQAIGEPEAEDSTAEAAPEIGLQSGPQAGPDSPQAAPPAEAVPPPANPPPVPALPASIAAQDPPAEPPAPPRRHGGALPA